MNPIKGWRLGSQEPHLGMATGWEGAQGSYAHTPRAAAH